MKADRSRIDTADLQQRMALMRATEAFEAVLGRHARAVEAARTVSEGLVQAIAAEVAQARSPATYGAAGLAASGDMRAVTLNRQA